MKRSDKLRAKLGEIRNEAQAIVDQADAENEGVMTDEQSTSFDALMDKKKSIEAQITQAEELEAMEAGTGRQTSPADPGKAPANSLARTNPTAEEDPMRGFSSAADFGRAVHAACLPGGDRDSRLNILGAPSNFHQESGQSEGYEVPPQMRDTIWELMFEEENLLSVIGPEPTESNQVGVVTDESTPWGATGVQANWAAEGTQFSASKLESKMDQMKLHKLYAFVLATDELLEDAPRLNARLTKGASQAIRFKSDMALVEGSGAGQPLGWMSSNALITVPKETSQTAATINATNVSKMYARLFGSANRAFWLCNRNTLPQLITMTIGNQPIWTPPTSGMKDAPGGMLLGLPIRFSEHAETLGTAGDIQLVNPEGYYAANKAGGIQFASSIHLYFDYGIQAFRWTFRLGGQPLLSGPITANKGDTKSHFITLATRS
ncbi:MAG: phage major capsid protein [Gammaproteobacteria bacterium]